MEVTWVYHGSNKYLRYLHVIFIYKSVCVSFRYLTLIRQYGRIQFQSQSNFCINILFLVLIDFEILSKYYCNCFLRETICTIQIYWANWISIKVQQNSNHLLLPQTQVKHGCAYVRWWKVIMIKDFFLCYHN